MSRAPAAHHGLDEAVHPRRAHRERIGRPHGSNLTDPPRGQYFQHPGMLWMETVHKAFHDRDLMFPRSGFDRVDVCNGQRHRLLAQDMLASRDGLQCPFGVLVISHRQVNGLDPRIVQQRLQRVVSRDTGLLRGVFRQRFGGSAGAPAGDCDEFGIGSLDDGWQQSFVDARGAEDAPTEFGLIRHARSWRVRGESERWPHGSGTGGRGARRTQWAPKTGAARRCGSAPRPSVVSRPAT